MKDRRAKGNSPFCKTCCSQMENLPKFLQDLGYGSCTKCFHNPNTKSIPTNYRSVDAVKKIIEETK